MAKLFCCLQWSDTIAISLPGGKCLTPLAHIGAGANGFVLQVADESNNRSALKIVPVIVKANDTKCGKMNRERLFYHHLKDAQHTPNLARPIAWWLTENVDKSAYLRWNKSLRKQLNVEALDYPNQLVKKTSGQFKLCVYFVQMEYYAAGNLRTWLEANSEQCQGTYPLRIQLFCDILSAINFLHERGLMHRGICPNNIFLAKDLGGLYAVLGDFDSIVLYGEQALWPLTKVRETFRKMLGTDPYAAPEIDGGDYNEQCDLFSLGVIALNLFFNIVKYNRLRNTLYKIYEKNVFPSCICTNDSRFWGDILKAQLSHVPEHRMSSKKLLIIMKAKEQSLNLQASESKTKLMLIAQAPSASKRRMRSREQVELVVTDDETGEQSFQLLEHYTNSLIRLKDIWSGRVELPQRPDSRGFSVAACAGKLFIVGGEQKLDNKWQTSSTVQQYDSQTGWQDWSSMLEKRSWCGAAALGGRLFVVGGFDNNKTYLNAADEGHVYGVGLSSVEECDLETGRWAHVAPMTNARWSMGVAAMGSLLFAVGGRHGSTLNAAEWYDPRAGRWTETAPMNEPRLDFGCVALGERLYVAGGWTYYQTCTASVEWFDLRASKWTRVKNMDAPRGGFALAALNGQLFAAGGLTSPDETVSKEFKSLDTVEMYDEKENRWNTLKDKLPWKGCCAGCVVEE